MAMQVISGNLLGDETVLAAPTRAPRPRPEAVPAPDEVLTVAQVSRASDVAKRILDIVVASLALVAVLPLIGFCALAIRLVSRGPAFFCHVREGKDAKPFRLWKLRTMHVDAEARLQQLLESDADARLEWQSFMKLRRDPRVIPLIGNFLRKSSFDELPQLWNVIRGDMSLVGPRPFPEYHLSRFDRAFRRARHSVRPGITGIWQVSARSNGDLLVQRRCDLAYLQSRSLQLDLKILLQTATVVVKGTGAY